MVKKAAMKKVLSCFVIIAILISAIPAFAMDANNALNSVSGHLDPCVALSSTVIYVPDDYSTIQGAVDAAKSGETIIVRDGRYTGNVVVNKPHLTIHSDNGAGATIVQAANSDDHVFEVTADYVKISGLTVKGAKGWLRAGIQLNSTNNCIISNNNVSNNFYGIQLQDSSNNSISGNICRESDHTGIGLLHSTKNDIADNACYKNYYNGVLLTESPKNEIERNTFEKNENGLYIFHTSNNIVKENICKNNSYGIRIGGWSSNNCIYLNDFINNADNAYSIESTNIWNSTSKITYTYKGNTYTSYEGNYWDDYSGTDASGDGLGDTPYNIDSESDKYPLMDMFENYRLGDGEKIGRVISAKITAGTDDGFAARTPEVFRADSTGITIGTDLKFDAFLRFPDLKIPTNATITKAYISVVPAVTNQAGPMVHISAADAANPTAPTTSSDFYARKRTTSSVNWDASSWAAGGSENSTDISSVIQELVDSYDYSAGAPILIVFDIGKEGAENQYFAAFEDAEYEAPKLFIEYSTGESTGGGSDITPPQVTIISPDDGRTYTTTEIALAVTANASISRWSYGLNGVDPLPFSRNITIAARVGDNSEVVFAEDMRGNAGSASVSFYLESFY